MNIWILKPWVIRETEDAFKKGTNQGWLRCEQDFFAFMNLLLKIQYYLKTFFFPRRYSREQPKKKKKKIHGLD